MQSVVKVHKNYDKLVCFHSISTIFRDLYQEYKDNVFHIILVIELRSCLNLEIFIIFIKFISHKSSYSCQKYITVTINQIM
jgi:hypothetical protein